MTREIVTAEGVFAPGPEIKLSQAVKSNGFIFVMGCGARTASGALAGDDVRTQTRQCLNNVKAILAAADAGLEHAVRIDCYLTRPEDTDGFNEVYNEYFDDAPPARALYYISGFRDPGILAYVVVTAEDPNYVR